MKILCLAFVIFIACFSHHTLGAHQSHDTRFVFVSPVSSKIIRKIILAPLSRILNPNLSRAEVAWTIENRFPPYVYSRPAIHNGDIGLHLTLLRPNGENGRPGNYDEHGNLTKDSIQNLKRFINLINNKTLSLRVENVMVRGRYLTLSVRIDPGFEMRRWNQTKREETLRQGRELLHRFFGDEAHISVIEISNIDLPPFSRHETSPNMLAAYPAICQYYLVDAPKAPDYQALYDSIRAELIRQLKPITLRDQFLTDPQRAAVEAAPGQKIFLLSWGKYLVINLHQSNLGLPLRMFGGIGPAAQWHDTDIIPYLENLINNPPTLPVNFAQIQRDILEKLYVIFDGIGHTMPVLRHGVGAGGGLRAGRFDREFFVNNRLFYPRSLLNEPKIRELARALGEDPKLNEISITLRPLEQ